MWGPVSEPFRAWYICTYIVLVQPVRKYLLTLEPKDLPVCPFHHGIIKWKTYGEMCIQS